MFNKFKIIFDHRIILAALTLLLALYLQTVPLANSLDYEFSAVMGIWFFIAGGFLFLQRKKNENVISFLKERTVTIGLIIILPFFISFINSAFLNVCPFKYGILFYLFISVISFLLGMLSGQICSLSGSKHPYTQFILIFFGFIAVSIVEFYLFPQIYAYNPLIGFFPGTIYDELIEFTSHLVFYRVYNIIFLLAIVFLLKQYNNKFSGLNERIKRRRITRAASSLFILFTLLFVSFIFNLLLGFSTPLWKIEKGLGGRLFTEHFILIYPKEISPGEIKISAMHHEFYYDEIRKTLNADKKEKIISLLFSSSEQKKEYIGSANADISKPWQNCIITDFENHDATLKHEIVHAFSGELGTGIFKAPFNLNPGIIEGTAAAVEDKFALMDIYYAADMIKRYNPKISIPRMFAGFNFFGQNSSISYVYSGAFIKFLIERYGAEIFKKFYAHPDFGKYYGKPVENLEKEFDAFIDSFHFTYNPGKAVLYFAGKPVFMKKCPRYTAYGLKNGNEYYQKRNFEKSLNTFKDVYNNSESNTALTGIINSLIKLNKPQEALAFLEKEIGKFAGSGSYSRLRIHLADLYVRNDLFGKAAEIYSAVIKENAHQEYVFGSLLRMMLLKKGNNLLKLYVEGKAEDKAELIKKADWIPPLYRYYWLIGNAKPDEIKKEDLLGKDEGIKIHNEMELYLLFGVSRYLKDKGYFEEAAKEAEKTMHYASGNKELTVLLQENERKINYFLNFEKRKLF